MNNNYTNSITSDISPGICLNSDTLNDYSDMFLQCEYKYNRSIIDNFEKEIIYLSRISKDEEYISLLKNPLFSSDLSYDIILELIKSLTSSENDEKKIIYSILLLLLNKYNNEPDKNKIEEFILNIVNNEYTNPKIISAFADMLPKIFKNSSYDKLYSYLLDNKTNKKLNYKFICEYQNFSKDYINHLIQNRFNDDALFNLFIFNNKDIFNTYIDYILKDNEEFNTVLPKDKNFIETGLLHYLSVDDADKYVKYIQKWVRQIKPDETNRGIWWGVSRLNLDEDFIKEFNKYLHEEALNLDSRWISDKALKLHQLLK